MVCLPGHPKNRYKLCPNFLGFIPSSLVTVFKYYMGDMFVKCLWYLYEEMNQQPDHLEFKDYAYAVFCFL